jgi:hypothetical protein
MLRKTKVNLRYAMMRRSKKFYSMSRQCEQFSALLIESTPLKDGWLAPNISPQGINFSK